MAADMDFQKVAYLLLCETINTGCDMAMMYEPLIIRNGTFIPSHTSDGFKYNLTTKFRLADIKLVLASDPILTVLVSLPVQLFIAWRVKILTQSIFVPVIIALFSFASFTGGIATGILAIILPAYADFPKHHVYAVIWLVTAAVADILITGALVLSLLHRRSGIGATDHLVNRIIRLTVQTGFVTVSFAVIDVALFMLLKGTTWNFIFDYSLSKLYSNSLLSTLNARAGWKPSSIIRDNVLFGSQGVGLESVPRGRTQIGILSDNGRHTSQHLKMVPMNAFESESGFHREDYTGAINDTPKYAEEV
ncbi:hypothetical protein JVU11DRAFT_7106 [Chiua virens]|nr:hypothetical protein JVU11DRAFT_7106 [Chiua virens]